MTPRIPAATPSGRGRSVSCAMTSWLSSDSEAARLTTMPAAVEMIRAGIWATSPSPTVRIV